MDTNEKGHRLWYVRRAGNVRGPFPEGQISSEILLGRIIADDELSRDRTDWKRLGELPQLVPGIMRQADNDTAEQRRVLARLREDERQHDRRDSGYAPESAERRHGDRRTVESQDVVTHRNRSRRWAEESIADESSLMIPMAVGMLILFGLVLYFLWYRPVAAPAPRDCTSLPGAGVNWNGCEMAGRTLSGAVLTGANLQNSILSRSDLSGANLERATLDYANLEGAVLRAARLRGASVKGAVLRDADLASADLRDTDLTYVNLQGAVLAGVLLAGAQLEKAIWLDGRLCGPGSVGECR